MPARHAVLDLVSIVVCALVWGTTWYAITLQLGAVDPLVSIVYRFGLASTLLFIWCGARGESRGLTLAQHAAILGLGLFTFALNYPLVYAAEARLASAVVALVFASLAFFNLVGFRLGFGQRAARSTWVAALLGVLGVAVLSWGELAHTHLSGSTLQGILLAVGGVVCSAVGNMCMHRGEKAGAPVVAATAWGMSYGTVLLALYAVMTGRHWSFEFRLSYVGSLVYLAVMGSVVAFVLYYGLARRRGYATASYISALTPPLAMTMSTLFEGKRWGTAGLTGLGLVLVGQVMLLRIRKA